MSFITHIFHKLVHVGLCPVGLCAHILNGYCLIDGIMAKVNINTNKQEVIVLGHDLTEQCMQKQSNFHLCAYWVYTSKTVHAVVSTSVHNYKYLLPEKNCVISAW